MRRISVQISRVRAQPFLLKGVKTKSQVSKRRSLISSSLWFCLSNQTIGTFHQFQPGPNSSSKKTSQTKNHPDCSRVVFYYCLIDLLRRFSISLRFVQKSTYAGSLAIVSDSAVCRFRKASRLNALIRLVCAHRLCHKFITLSSYHNYPNRHLREDQPLLPSIPILLALMPIRLLNGDGTIVVLSVVAW